jgi:hypothetical protein
MWEILVLNLFFVSIKRDVDSTTQSSKATNNSSTYKSNGGQRVRNIPRSNIEASESDTSSEEDVGQEADRQDEKSSPEEEDSSSEEDAVPQRIPTPRKQTTPRKGHTSQQDRTNQSLSLDRSPSPSEGVGQRRRSLPQGRSEFKKNLVELLLGKMPAVKPTASGKLQYVRLVKARSDHDSDEPDLIRVIIVHPGEPNEPLECSITIRLLPLMDARGKAKPISVSGIDDEDLPRCDYVALSYAWEGQTPTEEIQIRHGKSKLTLYVTANLKAALLALRHTRENRNFWADAISMDQDDDEEKSQQLPLMSRIYSEAHKVCVWLGNEGPDTSKAFILMKKIRRWQKFKTVVEKETTCEEWIAFIDLMKKPWFRRRWVVQEIVLAGRAELRCGPELIEWMHFAQAVAFFEAMRERVKFKFRQNPLYENHPDKFGEVREFSASRLVKVTSNVVSRRDDGHVVQKTESLESLISTLTPFEARERRDIVYAILSLAKDVNATSADVTLGEELKMTDLSQELQDRQDRDKILRVLKQILRNMKVDRFPVNYRKGFDEVCDDLYKFTTFHSGSLDLICRPWCPPGSTRERRLPSWVRPLKDRAFELDAEGQVERVNADTLVGLPGNSPYQASGRLRGEWRFERDGGPEGTQILAVKGFQLDTIKKIEDSARGGTIPKTWLTYKKPDVMTSTSPQDRENGVSEQFWRTMVAGKGPNGQNPLLSYSLVCQELFESDHDINLEKKRNLTTNDVLKEFIDRVLSVIWGRKLARTAKQKRLALLPEATQRGDVIAILYGCSVPVVLRKLKEKTTTREEIWELIGECYVYDMMAGEALIARRLGAEDEAAALLAKGINPDEAPEAFYKNRREFKIR